MEKILNEGYPSYTTAAGWLGYSDEKIIELCNNEMMKWWNDSMIEWWNDSMIEWCNGAIMDWRIDGMEE